ncbi:MAG TPA: mycothiol synthase [Acidimicrobiia bacterium]|nr:mycothiol synthase [Acidimicrobiia bacterium]
MATIRATDLRNDRSALEALFERAQTSDGHHPIGEHQYLELAAGPGEDLVGLAAEADRELVGYAGLTPGFEPGWWTLEVAVDPGWRTAEMFRDLLSAAVKTAAIKGGRAVRLWAFLPRLVEAAFDTGFEAERELRRLWRPLPVGATPVYPPGLVIDRFLPGRDNRALLDLNNAAFQGHPENGNWTPQVLAYRMSQPWFDPEDVITVRQETRMIGFCWVKRERPGEGEIYVVAVAPEMQGRGLGRALMIDGLRIMARQGLAKATLYVDSGNVAAIRLYEDLGFRLDHIDRSFVRSL